MEKQYTIKDKRDDKTYFIAKLKMSTSDTVGTCWMTSNLDLDLNADVTYTNENTDLNSVASWKPVRSTLKQNEISSWSNDYNTPYSYDSGDTTNGNYYNWSATVANNDTSSHTTQYENMPDSICPKGWRLATGYGGSSSVNGDFKNLNNAYGGSTSSNAHLLADPLYFDRSGYVSGGSLNSAGLVSYYWSSTVAFSDYAYSLYFYNTSVSPTYSNYCSYGYSVRCIAR